MLMLLPRIRLARLVSARHSPYSISAHKPIPWFVEQEDKPPVVPQSHAVVPPPVPEDAPAIMKTLHAQLAQSPYLDTSLLVLSRAITVPAGPPLPLCTPRGRRKRGATYAGESKYDSTNGIWDWMIMAQVKEGTENKGTIERVVGVVRKTLCTSSGRGKQIENGWAMIDVGKNVVHVMSRKVREKYFN